MGDRRWPRMSWARLGRYCLLDGIPCRSAGVALVVGTVLDAINRGDVLQRRHANAAKRILAYLVPYAVASKGAVSCRLRSAG